MNKEYLVFVEACDYFDVEAENEEQAKVTAVEVFSNNSHAAAFQVTIMREREDGVDSFPDEEKHPLPSPNGVEA
jgi:hypothetical protein